MKKNKGSKKEISQRDADVERIIRQVFSEEEMFKRNKLMDRNVPGRRNPKEKVLR